MTSKTNRFYAPPAYASKYRHKLGVTPYEFFPFYIAGYEGENHDQVKIIKNIARLLRLHRGLYNVVPITTAKVPIVKVNSFLISLNKFGYFLVQL